MTVRAQRGAAAPRPIAGHPQDQNPPYGVIIRRICFVPDGVLRPEAAGASPIDPMRAPSAQPLPLLLRPIAPVRAPSAPALPLLLRPVVSAVESFQKNETYLK